MIRRPVTEKNVEKDILQEEIGKLNSEIEIIKEERDASL